MKILYLPVYRLAASYAVSFGRRWSILEHLLLIELTKNKRTLAELADVANVPERLVVEALINLLRANWIEVRSSGEIFFQSTPAGKRRATEATLPPQVQRSVRWISLCVDRLTGAWLRADDLDLVYENDMPLDAEKLDPKIHTYHSFDGRLRELFYLAPDETLEATEPQFRNPSKPFARIVVGFDRIEGGLPSDAPLALKSAVVDASESVRDAAVQELEVKPTKEEELLFDTVDPTRFIVGGTAHRDLIRRSFEEARSTVILHSCFLDAGTLEGLLPDLEDAAKRRIQIELLWGLHNDPEDQKSRNTVGDCVRVLTQLSPIARQRVQLSSLSSDSHAKILVWDTGEGRDWISVIGSCNYLSSWFNALDISVELHSQRLALRLMGFLLASQLPASGTWSPVARRLNSVWERIRQNTLKRTEGGTHNLTVLVDQDHYACVRQARDNSREGIILGCDIYGAAAETSVLVPMARAASLGRRVRILYQRPSKQLISSGKVPDPKAASDRGLSLETFSGLHGKFLVWDDENVAVTSFNWLSTVAAGSRVRGAELGVLIEGPGLRGALSDKMSSVTDGSLSLTEFQRPDL